MLNCAEKEKNTMYSKNVSLWNYEQIDKVIIPEIRELLSYAYKGEIYFKYGKKKRFWNHHI